MKKLVSLLLAALLLCSCACCAMAETIIMPISTFKTAFEALVMEGIEMDMTWQSGTSQGITIHVGDLLNNPCIIADSTGNNAASVMVNINLLEYEDVSTGLNLFALLSSYALEAVVDPDNTKGDIGEEMWDEITNIIAQCMDDPNYSCLTYVQGVDTFVYFDMEEGEVTLLLTLQPE